MGDSPDWPEGEPAETVRFVKREHRMIWVSFGALAMLVNAMLALSPESSAFALAVALVLTAAGVGWFLLARTRSDAVERDVGRVQNVDYRPWLAALAETTRAWTKRAVVLGGVFALLGLVTATSQPECGLYCSRADLASTNWVAGMTALAGVAMGIALLIRWDYQQLHARFDQAVARELRARKRREGGPLSDLDPNLW